MENKTIHISAVFRVDNPEGATKELAKAVVPYMETIIHKDIYHNARCLNDKETTYSDITFSVESYYNENVGMAVVIEALEKYFKAFEKITELQITFRYK